MDRDTVYFYVETKDPLTPHTGTNWMLLLIDADQNPNTGWYGYDYLINQRVIDDKTTTIQRYAPNAAGGPWVEVARLKYRYSGKALEMAVPRKLLRLEGRRFHLRFPLVRQSYRPERSRSPSAPAGTAPQTGGSTTVASGRRRARRSGLLNEAHLVGR